MLRLADATVPVVPQVTSSKAAVASLLAIISHFASELQLSNLALKADASIQSATQQPDSVTDAACSPSDSALSRNVSTEKSLHASSPLGSSVSSSVSSSASSRSAALAAATALHNLLLDKGAQQLVCDLQGIGTISKLLVPSDWILAARAAGECSTPFWSLALCVVSLQSQIPCTGSCTALQDALCCCWWYQCCAHANDNHNCEDIAC